MDTDQTERERLTAAELDFARRCVSDEQAQEALVRQYSASVHRLTRRILGNASDAEDLLHDVFVEVLRSIGSYRGEASLKNWIYRIAIRRIFKHLRQEKRRRNVHLQLIDPQDAEASRRRHDSLHARIALHQLHRVVSRLPTHQRVVLVLHGVEGYSLPEAAALLGISVTAAKKRVWRARRTLARLAQNDGVLSGYLKERLGR